MALPLYANVLPNGRGKRSGLYPTVPECKAELKRSISWTNELKVEPELRYIQIPPQGEAMPTALTPEGSRPLGDDWVVNDRTALYVNIPMPEAGPPLQRDLMGHEKTDTDENKDDEKKGQAEAEDSHGIATPQSDASSIKERGHAKSATDMQRFDMDELTNAAQQG